MLLRFADTTTLVIVSCNIELISVMLRITCWVWKSARLDGTYKLLLNLISCPIALLYRAWCLSISCYCHIFGWRRLSRICFVRSAADLQPAELRVYSRWLMSSNFSKSLLLHFFVRFSRSLAHMSMCAIKKLEQIFGDFVCKICGEFLKCYIWT